jgi:hypothetical protein
LTKSYATSQTPGITSAFLLPSEMRNQVSHTHTSLYKISKITILYKYIRLMPVPVAARYKA